MQQSTLQPDTVFGKETLKFPPIIDLNRANETCIYSTLIFVIDEANYPNIPTTCTFDQLLWQKVYAIAKNQNLNIVCRLDGFHTLRNFLGSIGNLMSGSGLA